jgi:hypothetical protein
VQFHSRFSGKNASLDLSRNWAMTLNAIIPQESIAYPIKYF